MIYLRQLNDLAERRILTCSRRQRLQVRILSGKNNANPLPVDVIVSVWSQPLRK